MKRMDIFNHMKTYLFHGAELATILENDPSEWATWDKFLQEKLNFDEFAQAVALLRIQNKVIRIPNEEPKTFTLYSDAFESIGDNDLAEIMAKIEFMIKNSYERNFNFLQDEIRPYLQELYELNKSKFDARLNNNEKIEDNEYKIMVMLGQKLEFISEKIKKILHNKPVAKTVSFRRNKDILVLIDALTS